MSTDPAFCFSLLEEELQRNFAESLTNVVCSENNNDSIRRLDAYCSSLNKQTSTPLAILGEQGSGKSALLANWARNRQQVANDDEHIFFHAIGCSNLSCVSHLLRRLIRWLVKQFTLTDDIDLSDDDKLPWMLPRLLERVSKKRKVVIMVLDGIQNSKSSHNDIGLKWLPSSIPSNVRLIVSSTCGGIDPNPTSSEYAKQQQLKSQRICDEIERRKWSTITLSPVVCKNSSESIAQMLSRFNSEINGHMLNRSLALLFISRHGLHEDELFDLLGRMTHQSWWNETQQSSVVSLSKAETLSLTGEDKKVLVEKLCLLGVVCIDTKLGLLLAMPANNSILRNVVYEKCITSKARETEIRDILIEYFEAKDPSPRYCEEVPWQQQKNMSPNLNKTIVDLRVLDIMFNSDLKHELYLHLKRLVLGGNFDIVYDFNKSVEKWKKKEKPTSTRLALMCLFIADVLMYFDTKFAKEQTEFPPFLRDNISQAERFLEDLHDPDGVLISSSASAVPKTTKFYFYSRWLWVNWPLIALKTSADTQKVDPDPSNPTQVKKTGSEEHVAINTENTVRESALTRTEPLPEALVMKLEKMKSSDTLETQKKNSCTTTAIPFSNSRYEKKLQEQLLLRPSHVESLEQKERDAKQLLDALKIERKKRESLLQGLRDDEALISTAAAHSKQRQEKDDSKISEIHKRSIEITNLHGKAVSIESRLTEIMIALDQCDPANLRRHEELEQQILLAKQQICDVSREGKLMLETASKAQQEAITVKSESLLVNKQREKIRPNIESLQSRINEEEDRLKQARVKSFDPKAFSKKLQIEGILAKRRQDKMMRRMVTANRPNLDLEAMVAEHPMSKLVVLGLSDPQDIAAKFQQGKEKALDLQQEQESVESRLKEKQAELNRLHIQLNQMDLANSCAKSPSPVMATDPKSSENIELLQRQNQLAVMTKLTTNVKHYLLALREKVQSIEQQHDSFRDFIDTKDESNMDSNTNRVITLVKELCDDFLHSQKLATKSSPARFANIRILAKDESESRFTNYTSAEVALGDSDKGTATCDQYLNELLGFIDHSLSQESMKEQRLVNLRSPPKQGSKGIVLDTALWRLN